MKSRLRSAFLVAFSFIIFTNATNLIFTTGTYAAEVKDYSKMNEDEKIVSYIYYKALSDCLDQGEINTSFISGNISDIFNNPQNGTGPSVDVGLFAEAFAINSSGITAEAGDGVLVCSNIAKAAFDFWGINSLDKDAILQSFGYKKTDAYWCRGTEIASNTIIVLKEGAKNQNGTQLADTKFVMPFDPKNSTYFDTTNGPIDNETDADIYCSNFISTQYYQFMTSSVTDENNQRLVPFIKESVGYVGVEGATGSYIKEYIKTNIFKTEVDPYNTARHIEPLGFNDAQKYYLYKYVFQSINGCSGVSYGTTDSLNASPDQTKTLNVKNGATKGDGIKYPYVEISMINPEKITEKVKYSFVMESKIAADNLNITIYLGEEKTCTDIAYALNLDNTDSLANKILSVMKDIKNPLSSQYNNILKLAGGSNTIPIGVGSDKNNDNEEEDKNTCAIDGIGWLLCPVVNFLAQIIDHSWGILASFLEVDSSIVSTTNPDNNETGATYRAWQIVRNIANVVFAIVFLIIIFSQVTSFGISNYGIKKMLPKLIIAAILVNLSFYICQIAVDISNILGYSIKNIFDNLTNTIADQQIFFNPYDDTQTGNGMLGIAGTVLATAAGGVYVYAQIGTLIPVLLGGIVAVLMILFMLIGRQALVILLVVLSPLAFVAYLLPNTSKLFDKWKKLFMSLLLLFPIVALVLGASSMASSILSSTFQNATSEHNFGTVLGQIAAAAVAILPLFVVPGMLKKSLDGAGNIGGTLNKLSDKWGKGFGGKWTDSKLNKHIAAERANKSARIQGGVYEGSKLNPNVWRSKLHKGINQAGWSGKYGDKMSAMGVSQSDKFNEENVSLATSRLDSLTLGRSEIEKIALGTHEKYKGNVAMQQAAIKDMVKTNNVNGINSLWDATMKMDNSQNSKYIRNTFANSLLSSSSRPTYYGGGAIASMRINDKTKDSAQMTYQDTIKKAIKDNAYSPDKIARADKDELIAISKLIEKDAENKKANINPETYIKQKDLEMLAKNAQIAQTNPNLSYLVNKNYSVIDNIASFVTLSGSSNQTTSSTSSLVNQYGEPFIIAQAADQQKTDYAPEIIATTQKEVNNINTNTQKNATITEENGIKITDWRIR